MANSDFMNLLYWPFSGLRLGQFQAREEGKNPTCLVDRHTRPVNQIGQGDQNLKAVFAFPIANTIDGRKVGRIRLIEDPIMNVLCLAVNEPPHELLATQYTFFPFGAMPIEIDCVRGEIAFSIFGLPAGRYQEKTGIGD